MADLPKRELGRTGLQVTMLGYGAMELRGAPRGRDVTEAQAETILHAVLDAGINYIDTSIDHTAAFARQVVLGAPVGDIAPDALLAESVVDRGVDVVDAGVEHGMENCLGLRLGDVTAARRSPQLHRAVSEHGDLKPGPPELAFRKIRHICPLSPPHGTDRAPSSPARR